MTGRADKHVDTLVDDGLISKSELHHVDWFRVILNASCLGFILGLTVGLTT